MRHRGLGPRDRPHTRLFGWVARVLPAAVRESSALDLPITSARLWSGNAGEVPWPDLLLRGTNAPS
jgi:hypothetical protein